MSPDNLMDTHELDAIKDGHGAALACAFERLGSSLKTVTDRNGSQDKKDNIKTVVMIISAIGVVITLIIVLLTVGGWKKQVEIETKLNGANLAVYCEKAEVESNKVWERIEDSKDDRTAMKIASARVEYKVDTIDVRQREMSDDVKKILEKIE